MHKLTRVHTPYIRTHTYSEKHACSTHTHTHTLTHSHSHTPVKRILKARLFRRSNHAVCAHALIRSLSLHSLLRCSTSFHLSLPYTLLLPLSPPPSFHLSLPSSHLNLLSPPSKSLHPLPHPLPSEPSVEREAPLTLTLPYPTLPYPALPYPTLPWMR